MNQQEIYFNNLLLLSGNITTILSLIPILVAFWKRKEMNELLKIFWGYLATRFFLNVMMELFIWAVTNYRVFWKPILTLYKIENTLFFNILFYLSNYIFLGIFYRKLLIKKIYQTGLKILIPVICVASVVILIFIDGYQNFGSVGPFMNGIYICTLPMIYLWYLFLEDRKGIAIYKKPYFWISMGLLVPHGIDLIFLLTANNLYAENFILYCQSHIARNCLEIIAQISFAVSFYLSTKEFRTRMALAE